MKSMSEDWKETLDKTKRRHMLKDLKFVRVLVKFSVYAAVASVFLIGFNAIYDSFRVKDANKPLVISSEFFFNTESSPIYEIVWLGQFIACVIVAVVLNIYNGFFIISVNHLCAQLVTLGIDIKNILSQSTAQTSDHKIKLVVQKHLQLKR